MLALIHNRVKETRTSEDGLTIAEIIVAFAIIVGVLLSSAMLMGYSFTTQSASEGRDKAVQIARDIIEESRQVPWGEFGVEFDKKNADVFSGGVGGDFDYNGEEIFFLPDGIDSSLTYNPYQETFLGEHVYTVRTYITNVNPASFDGTLPFQNTNETEPRRITVVVSWVTPEGPQEVVQTWVRAPLAAECIPNHALNTSAVTAKPAGCK